jgi:hypothetical protein
MQFIVKIPSNILQTMDENPIEKMRRELNNRIEPKSIDFVSVKTSDLLRKFPLRHFSEKAMPHSK